MQTLCLFHGEHAEQFLVAVTHPDSYNLEDNPEGIEKLLEERFEYNDAGGLFLIPLVGDIVERPIVYGQDGTEIPCHFLELV